MWTSKFRTPRTAVWTLIGAWVLTGITAQAETEKIVRSKMGSRFEITAVHSDPDLARQAIEKAYAEIDRIEDLISSWRETSETSRVNRQAGQAPVVVSQELFNLIRRSLKVSELTGGAFDITFAGVGRLWDFSAREPSVPAEDDLKALLSHVGHDKVLLDAATRTVFLDDPLARLGFGAIGKGYAANRAAIVLKEHGIDHGVVNAGGDLVAFGQREDGRPWDIGIAHPRQPGKVFARLPLSEQSVVTSGDYESYFLIDGRRYAHILDPRTGYPVQGLHSVTIVCPNAELADALATAVFVLGREHGLKLVDQLRGIEALIVDDQGQIHFSRNLRSQLIFPKEDATR